MHEDGSIDDDISSVVLFRLCVLLMFIAKSRRKTVKVETRDKEIMTKSTFGLNGNLKYPETTLKIRKMCGYFANPLENDMKFSPQTSFDFAHAQTLFSSVGLRDFHCSVKSRFPQWNAAIHILLTPKFSSQFSFPLEVRENYLLTARPWAERGSCSARDLLVVVVFFCR